MSEKESDIPVSDQNGEQKVLGKQFEPPQQHNEKDLRGEIVMSKDTNSEFTNSKTIKKSDKLLPVHLSKYNKILKALEGDIDVSALRQLAINRGGMINNDLRKRAWPRQLDVDLENIPSKPDQEILHSHRDYTQVVMDVNRSLKRFPPGMDDTERFALQDILIDVIMRVLVNNSQLHYYQGFHDICVTFLLVVEEDVAFALVEKLSQNHLRDFMDANMERTKNMLNYLYPIVNKASPTLCDYMERAELGTIFCLSWLITWYGHVLNDIKHIVRLYDFFIACHQLMPIYLAAAIVLYRQDEILETECEMCFIHSLLSYIPENLPFEQLIIKAGDLYIQFPPQDLACEAEYRSKENARNAKQAPVRSKTKIQRFKQQVKWVSSVIPDVGRHYLLTTAVAAAITAALCYSTTDWGWIEWNWF